MAEDNQNITEPVIEEAEVILTEEQLAIETQLKEENDILMKAQAIQKKRDEQYAEEEKKILVLWGAHPGFLLQVSAW